MRSVSKAIRRLAAANILLPVLLCISAAAQAPAEAAGSAARTSEPLAVNLNIKQVDDVSVKELLLPKGRPLLVNFWATWCVPCREEFPELIEIDRDYRGKIDFIIISLDDPVEIGRDVPAFLKEMGSTMTPFLLRTQDESAVIGAISDTWQGGLPFTVLYDAEGSVVHARQGKIRVPVVRAALDQLTSPDKRVSVTEYVKVVNGRTADAIFYFRNNWAALREAAKKRGLIDSFEMSVVEPSEGPEFDIVLSTRYADRDQHAASEKNFSALIKELRPEGPMLLSSAKPDEFRRSLFVTLSSVTGSP